MFALTFEFPTARYHATPWGRSANEADIAWPPEPWRLLRALVAVWWRKGVHERWMFNDFSALVSHLAESLPEFALPEGVVHTHTRHYMPQGKIKDTSLVFDSFAHLPKGAKVIAAWPNLTLCENLFKLAGDLADSLGYLGRAESWTICRATDSWSGESNCRVLGSDDQDIPVRVLAARTPADYEAERQRLLANVRCNSTFRGSSQGDLAVDTLPECLVDAISLDTSDYRRQRWSRPPAAREIVYLCKPTVHLAGVRQQPTIRTPSIGQSKNLPTVARYLVAGRPRPRIEDAVRFGELMRLAALAQYGWSKHETSGRRIPLAPWKISGRNTDNQPINHPKHPHAFWLPEDADCDGWIDHISIYIKSGIDGKIQAKLEQITHLWQQSSQQQSDNGSADAKQGEWQLALEGFGCPPDFAECASIFSTAREWESVTPFMAAGYLKGSRYRGEVSRLLRRRGRVDANEIEVKELKCIYVGGAERLSHQFYRFRSNCRERQPDAAGAFLRVTFPQTMSGPLAIGFGSHFGLGLFKAINS